MLVAGKKRVVFQTLPQKSRQPARRKMKKRVNIQISLTRFESMPGFVLSREIIYNSII